MIRIICRIIAISAIILMFPFSLGITDSYADEINPGVYSADSQPFGISHSEWTAKWWQWFMGIPADQSPADDATGERCSTHQFDPDVWFLTGTFEGNAERTCKIPAGVGILLPIIASVCSMVEYPELKSEADLRQCAVKTNAPTEIGATLNGVEIKDPRRYSVESPLFNLTYPENNLAGVNPGQSPAVSHFFSLFLEPLPVGQHELTFHQLTVDDPTTGVAGFAYKITYHLEVVERTFNTTTETIVVADEPSAISLNSSSSVSNFSFSEENKKISFTVSESGPQGVAIIPIGSVLAGPFTIMIGENLLTDFRTSMDNDTETASIVVAYPQGTHEITIVGTNIVPEFATLSMIILALSISIIVAIMSFTSRHKHFFRNDKGMF